MQIQIHQANAILSGYDILAKVLSITFNGEENANRLLDGVFCLPYEEITQSLDPNKPYFYDRLIQNEDGNQVPQIFAWRYWGYQTYPFMEELAKAGYRIIEEKKENTEIVVNT